MQKLYIVAMVKNSNTVVARISEKEYSEEQINNKEYKKDSRFVSKSRLFTYFDSKGIDSSGRSVFVYKINSSFIFPEISDIRNNGATGNLKAYVLSKDTLLEFTCVDDPSDSRKNKVDSNKSRSLKTLDSYMRTKKVRNVLESIGFNLDDFEFIQSESKSGKEVRWSTIYFIHKKIKYPCDMQSFKKGNLPQKFFFDNLTDAEKLAKFVLTPEFVEKMKSDKYTLRLDLIEQISAKYNIGDTGLVSVKSVRFKCKLSGKFIVYKGKDFFRGMKTMKHKQLLGYCNMIDLLAIRSLSVDTSETIILRINKSEDGLRFSVNYIDKGCYYANHAIDSFCSGKKIKESGQKKFTYGFKGFRLLDFETLVKFGSTDNYKHRSQSVQKAFPFILDEIAFVIDNFQTGKFVDYERMILEFVMEYFDRNVPFCAMRANYVPKGKTQGAMSREIFYIDALEPVLNFLKENNISFIVNNIS